MYKIAIIIINYNSSEYTYSCIKSILTQTDKSLNYQIIVIDNASKIEDYTNLISLIKTIDFNPLTIRRSKINTGFGGGNMQGIQFANAEYYVFINNDSIFENDCLSIMLQEMDKNHSIGISGPLCHNENGRLLPTLDYFASPAKEIFGRTILHAFNPKKYPSRTKITNTPQKGQFVAGSFMLIKAIDFHKIGGFDTNIFLYYEETDICKRLNKIGKFAYLIPSAKFIHYHGISTPKSIDIKIELKISFLYIIRKHYSYISFKFLLTFLQIKYFLSSIFKPKYWKLFFVLIRGAHLKYSLKQKQCLVDD